ncbi:MAG: hypothetical protein E5X34_28915 [Mesorhizobium sp.]|uniref:DUF6731 family protein n=1 Tax=Mesorhizobium sp. TaxID=1871066 RepID=UPI001203DA67|nr:DUF6731 family protein [Mesorhizobium sp.]TIR15520.1 MAG: hypothetical protein E5X34_28915 [Mesorhizobium sp.]
MKIHAFRAMQIGLVNLAQTLDHIGGLPLEQRLRDISGSQIRLEAAVHGDNLWSLDFGGIRMEGPGRASANMPIQDFEMAEDEGFGHETAACFDGEFLVLQYNHFGPRVARIREYLSRFGREIAGGANVDGEQLFNFVPVLKEDANERLAHMGLVKSMEISFYVPGIVANNGINRPSLSALLNTPLIGTASKVRIQISAARDRASSLALNQVRQAVDDLVGLREDVSELQLIAKETEDSPSEPVDFLEARLEADIPVQRVGRRYGRNERWVALRQALDTWRANGQLA